MSTAYGLDQVKMLDPYCINAFEKDVAYLKKLDEERLLAGFYETAGLASPKIRYGGWENMLIGGHTLGHYLTAVAQAYANAQCSSADKEILFAKIKKIIDALLECQAHSKGKPGFVFGAEIRDPENVEAQFDLVEQNKTNIITEAWVPWYTMHKILDGVVNVYRFTKYEPALILGSGIGDWTYDRASAWSEETHRTVLGIEYGGMNDALYDLYQFTKKKEHLEAAHLFDEEELFIKVASGEKNALNNRHANTTIPKFLGALNRYLTVGDTAYLEYVEKFWTMVTEHHTYATGGNSEWEHFGEDDILDTERTNCNNETCNTYNMLKMTRKLFMITGDRKYAKYYENTLINAILSSQNPETGMTMYFQPMASGYYKVYGTEFDKFWCCTGSGMENFTKLNDSIYFKEKGGITVNLFFSSEVTDADLGIRLAQRSEVPAKDAVDFTVNVLQGDAKQAKLRIRIPEWAKKTAISGTDKNVTEENGYYVLEGEWKDGETFALNCKSKVIAKSLPDCDTVFAFAYGPVLLSADLGTENMIDGHTGVDVTIPTNKIAGNEFLNIADGSVADFIANIDTHMERQGEELRFVLRGVDRELTFRPHYRKMRERYGIYWYFMDKSAAAGDAGDLQQKWAQEEKRRNAILDTVQPGYGQYENDDFHAMDEKDTVGSTDQGTSRYARANGFFAYHMKAEENTELLLELHLLREDNGKLLCVSLDDEEIFRKRLHYTGSQEEYVIEVPISAEQAKKHLQMRTQEDGSEVPSLYVGFRGSWGEPSARLFGFIYLLREWH